MVFRLLLICAVLWAGGCAKKEEKVTAVILYDFMSTDLPVPNPTILKQESGYIKIRLENGRILEHSGRYSVIRNP